jgi:hypothetical protein
MVTGLVRARACARHVRIGHWGDQLEPEMAVRPPGDQAQGTPGTEPDDGDYEEHHADDAEDAAELDDLAVAVAAGLRVDFLEGVVAHDEGDDAERCAAGNRQDAEDEERHPLRVVHRATHATHGHRGRLDRS